MKRNARRLMRGAAISLLLVLFTIPTDAWARFYEIETNTPIFADRDGVKKYDLAKIGYERRNGYAWYGTWPQRLLEKEYPAWKEKRAGKLE
jgi:Pectic acid lyase